MHSRRAFSGIKILEETQLKKLIWAIESMEVHRQTMIIFASDVLDLIKAINRPTAWPFFWYQVSELSLALENIEDWKLVFENRGMNRGAFMLSVSIFVYGYISCLPLRLDLLDNDLLWWFPLVTKLSSFMQYI